MLDAKQTLDVDILNDSEAKPYSFDKDGQHYEGVNCTALAVCEDKSKKRSVVVIKVQKVPEDHEIKAGVYRLEAPTNFFRRISHGIFQIAFPLDSEYVVFKPLK
jgi:hypothetical protein